MDNYCKCVGIRPYGCSYLATISFVVAYNKMVLQLNEKKILKSPLLSVISSANGSKIPFTPKVEDFGGSQHIIEGMSLIYGRWG